MNRSWARLGKVAPLVSLIFAAACANVHPPSDSTTVDVEDGKPSDATAATTATATPSTTPTTEPGAGVEPVTPDGSTAAIPSDTATTLTATMRGDSIIPAAPIAYEVGASKLRESSIPSLNQIKAFLDAMPDITLLRIEVHTDSDGDSAANLQLSKMRAMSVAKELVAEGVACKRLFPVGFGEKKPIAPNDKPEEKAKNRRTEFFVATLKGKPLNNRPVDGGGESSGDPCK